MASDSADDHGKGPAGLARVFVPQPDTRDGQQRLHDQLALLINATEAQARSIRCAIVLEDRHQDSSKRCLRVAAAPSLDPTYLAAIDTIMIPAAALAGSGARAAWSEFRVLSLRYGMRACWFIPLGPSGAHPPGYFIVYAHQHFPGECEWDIVRDAAELAATCLQQASSPLSPESPIALAVVNGLTSLANEVPGMIFQCCQLPDGSAFLPYASAGIDAIFELQPDQVAASTAPIRERVHPDDAEAWRKSIADSGASLLPWHLEFRVILPHQGECWRQGDAHPHRLLPGGGVLWHGMISDISDRKAMAVRLQDLAANDFLTGLLKRAEFLGNMEQEWRRLGGTNHFESTLLLFDLDRLKHVNNAYGHSIGDLVLQHFAAILRVERRRVDIGGRLGGAQFGMLLVGAGVAEALALARRVRERLAKAPLTEGELVVPMTVSAGIAPLLGNDATIHVALARADRALYRAKELGRNRIEISATE